MRLSTKNTSQHKAIVVDLKLKNGLIVKRVAVNSTGELLGRVVGGHTGLDESPFAFIESDILAYRKRGWATKLGIAKWHNI